MKKIYILLILIPVNIFAQKLDYQNSLEATKICTSLNGNNFIEDNQADIVLNKILSVIGASKRFVLKPCSNINNALAISYKGIRYILYDKDFMNSIASNTNHFSNTFILAHEVGHHINGHSIDIALLEKNKIEIKSLEQKRQQELEADEFAGFILAKLGASLFEASESVRMIASEKDDSFSTHPKKSKRLNAVKIGFNKGAENIKTKYTLKSDLIKAEEYFYKGLEKQKRKDYYGAIANYTSAIEFAPDNFSNYYNRAISKSYLKNYNGAIKDYTKVTELNPESSSAFYNMAIEKFNIGKFYLAIADYTKAIELDPKKVGAYYNRAIIKEYLGDLTGACEDYKKAADFGHKRAKSLTTKICD